MAKLNYKQTHQRMGTQLCGPVNIEGRVPREGGGHSWIAVETREGIVELWIDPTALLRQYAKKAMRSASGAAKLAKGAVQIRATKVVKRPMVRS